MDVEDFRRDSELIDKNRIQRANARVFRRRIASFVKQGEFDRIVSP
jgi:hypothetical protein